MLQLSWPILLGQMGHMLIGATNVFVAGRHSADMVAAIAIANSFSLLVYIFFLGFLMGISPVLSNKRGSGKDCGDCLLTCLVYAFAVSVAAILVLIATCSIVPFVGIEAKLVPLVQDYMFWFSWSYLGVYMYAAVREFLQAREDVMFVNMVALVAVAINLSLNFILVFGYAGLPAMGLNGLAVSTIMVRTLMMLIALLYASRFLKNKQFFDHSLIPEFIRVGFPTALAVFLEVAAFCGSTLLIARIDTFQTAAHNIVFTLASITYMVPLSIGAAAAVKVAHAHGESNNRRLKEYVSGALFLSILFMAAGALCFVLIPEHIMGIFTPDSRLIEIATPILFVAALFQIMDGAQVTLAGILRGLQITKPTFIACFIGYIILGIPCGALLAYRYHLGAVGIWIGLAVGLFAVTIILSAVLSKQLKRNTCGQAQ
ncbi:MAG: MATE family efflux transporter [Deltaproteobacteria bacterium]|nr:MATE family efflux transporter [Deltaproteobacteria bacterium]